jgi:hypothetical protein
MKMDVVGFIFANKNTNVVLHFSGYMDIKWKYPYQNKIMIAYLNNSTPIWHLSTKKLTKWPNEYFSVIEFETIVYYIIIHVTHHKI